MKKEQRQREAEKQREIHRDGDENVKYRLFAVTVPPCIRVSS